MIAGKVVAGKAAAATLVLPFLLAAANCAVAQQNVSSEFRVVTVAEGLQNPWAIAFLPGGDMLVTERSGNVRLVRGGVLLPTPVAGMPPVRARGQGGLLDIVAHPNFATNRLVYISYSKPNADGTQGTTAVIRAEFNNDRLNNVTEIFEAKAWSTGAGHYGSRIAFDGRGHVFITVGDRQAPPRGDLAAHPAQDLNSHQGKVIRLHEDGRVPADNPFVGRSGALPEIWSYGHRNLQGLAINPVTGDVWENEHGPQGGDELNLVLPGKNYGWPVIGLGVNYGGARTPIHASASAAGMEQPVHHWIPSIATSGMLIYSGDKFPAWKGNFFVGGLAGQQVARLVMDGQKVVSEETIFQGQGRVRDIRQGLDGYIYLVLDNSGAGSRSVVRLEPAADF